MTPHISYLTYMFFIIDHVPTFLDIFLSLFYLCSYGDIAETYSSLNMCEITKYLLLPSLLGELWSLLFCLFYSCVSCTVLKINIIRASFVFCRQDLEQNIPDIDSKLSWEFTDVRYSSCPKPWIAQSAKQVNFIFLWTFVLMAIFWGFLTDYFDCHGSD